MSALHKYVRTACIEQGITLKELADYMHTKPATLNHYLTGKRYFNEDFIKALAKELQEDEETIKSLVTISKVLYQAKD